MTITESSSAIAVCNIDDLIPFSGVAVKVESQQLAIFYLPRDGKSEGQREGQREGDSEGDEVFVLDNYDPLGRANVISRGIVGDRAGALVVASPLYKQHFDLRTGQCQEDPGVCIGAYEAKIEEGKVWVRL